MKPEAFEIPFETTIPKCPFRVHYSLQYIVPFTFLTCFPTSDVGIPWVTSPAVPALPEAVRPLTRVREAAPRREKTPKIGLNIAVAKVPAEYEDFLFFAPLQNTVV